MSRPKALPAHYIRDRMRWRAAVEKAPELTHGAKRYAARLAFRRWDAGRSAWSRVKAAAELRCSVRSVQRWAAELVRAGFLHVDERGRVVRGRRYLKVVTLLFPQVGKGDRLSPSSGTSPLHPHRATTPTAAEPLPIDLPDRTTARRIPPEPPARHPANAHPTGAGLF